MEAYRFTKDWFSWNIANWQEWLAPLAGRPSIRFLEIGCYEGRATIWLLTNILTHQTARIDCVDRFFDPDSADNDPAGYESRFDYNVRISRDGNKVRKIKSFSQESLRNLKLYSYDAIYVDGSHAAADVLEDAVLAFRLLKPGGLMIFDDYEWIPISAGNDNSSLANAPDPRLTPRAAIDAFLEVYNGQYELVAKDYQVAIKKF